MRQAHREPVASRPSGRRPATAPFVGRTVTLEPLDSAEHAVQLFAATHGDAARDAVWTYLPHGPFADVDRFATFLRHCVADAGSVFYAIQSHDTARIAGMICYTDIMPLDGVVEIAYVTYGPELQRTVGATEAVWLLLTHAFDELTYRRVTWKCNALNETSKAAAGRFGFRYEGTFFQHRILKGLNRDTAWFAMLDGDWSAVKANFQRWMAPDNFDAGGVQRSSLRELNVLENAM